MRHREGDRWPFLVGNLQLVLRLNERDPETFFSLFERKADSGGWPDADCTIMLQCVLTGRAQEAYSVLSVTDSLSYASVWATAHKVYEMVPETYLQWFKNSRKEDKQSYQSLWRTRRMALPGLQVLAAFLSWGTHQQHSNIWWIWWLVNWKVVPSISIRRLSTVTKRWDGHVPLRLLFEHLAAAWLTVNLMKCDFGGTTLIYLGHIMGQGQESPVYQSINQSINH